MPNKLYLTRSPSIELSVFFIEATLIELADHKNTILSY